MSPPFAARAINPPTLASRDAVNNERHVAATLLREIAGDRNFRARQQELHALADAVAAGGSAETVWHGVNLQESFTPENTIRLRWRFLRWIAALLGPLAGIAVFFPVAWNWWSLHQATEKFDLLIASGAIGEASFLQLWTTGFNGTLEPYLRLPEVARGAVVLIAASVLLILLERFFSAWSDRADDNRYQQCASRLAQALSYASITIRSSNVEEPLQSLDILSETVRELLTAHQQTREAAELLKHAALGLDATATRTTSNLEDSLEKLLAGFKRGLDGALASYDSSVQGITAELLKSANSISQDFGQSIVSTSGALEVSVTNAAGKLSASADEIAKASNGMETAASASTSAQLVLSGAATSIDANIRLLETNLRLQLQAVADAVGREVTSLGDTTGRFAKHVSDNTKVVDASLGRHTSALQHQISELTQIRASLERLANEKSPVELQVLAQTLAR